jgi:transposase
MDRIARLLGLLVTKDIDDKAEQALALHRAGFSETEITKMLGVGDSYLRGVKHRRKGKRRRPSRKSK